MKPIQPLLYKYSEFFEKRDKLKETIEKVLAEERNLGETLILRNLLIEYIDDYENTYRL